MKFSKPFTSTPSMSNFGSSSKPAPTQRSAPSSALDIVSTPGVDNWDMHLSSLAETTPSIAQDDSDLMDSSNFGLSIPSFSTTLDSDSLTEVFPWDASNFSTNTLTSADSALGHIHTSSFSLLTRPAASSHTPGYSLAAADNSDLSSFAYSSYPLLPVLSAAPYDVSATHEPPATISPADTQFLALSQIAPQRDEVKPASMTPASQIKQEAPREETKPTVAASRATSMDLDDEEDMEEGDYDDDDMDEEDGGDEYRERSRGRRKDGTIARSAAPSGARKSDTASTDGGASSTKRTKTTGAKQASTSDSGTGTPAPKRRGATRISVAEFVPPDVTGLSKREARLVKNRAAAFLSRQRKREEFETMEVRLQEILAENERLKRGSSGTPTTSNSDEVERLQQMLKVAEEREKALKEKLEEQTRLAEQARLEAQAQAQAQAKAIKVEEPIISLQDALKLQSPVSSQLSKEKESTRHGPGFNLMVLVFSLSLLSMPHQHQLQDSMRGAQPTRFNFTPSGSATAAAFPTLFENVLERWEGANRIKAVDNIDSIDEDDEMEVEVEPWEETSESQNKSGSSYVVDFEMPVVADEVGKDNEGKIKVRISPLGVPRPRRANGGLKPGELAWEGSALPPLESNGLDLSANAFSADWESWGGWKQFLSDDLVGVAETALAAEAAGPATSIDDASSPRSDFEQSVAENNSESWATPPPFPATLDNEESPATSSDAVKTSAGSEPVSEEQKPVDVDVALSTLPPWSRALVQAVAGEKLKARIRVHKKSRPGRNKNSIALSKSRMGFSVKV